MKRVFALISLLVLFGSLLLGCVPGTVPPDATPTPRSILTITPQSDVRVLPKADRPNILFILTDDLDAELGTTNYMPRYHELLVSQGLSIEDFFTTIPVCCPSRTTFLRGQYAHNHGVYGNTPPNGGFEKNYFSENESSTLGTWLQAAGYDTVFLGKYMNGYPFREDHGYVPAGWTEWYSPVVGRPYAGFKYTLNENGVFVDYEENGQKPSQYMTDVLSRKVVNFIRRSENDPAPFFIYLSTFAPHEPAKPAPRHAELFPELQAPRTASFNEVDVSDKPDGIRHDPLMADKEIARLDELYRLRVRSMQAVDEMIAKLVTTLKETGQLENTYIIFTSDNGFHLGQHRLQAGKSTPYEEDIRVPLVIRGPGIEAGSSVSGYLTGNIDFAPTIAELAGVVPPPYVDGRSMLPLFGNELPPVDEWRSSYLIEFYGFESEEEVIGQPSVSYASFGAGLEPPGLKLSDSSVTPVYLGLRTLDYLYVEYNDGFKELYDLKNDPYEMENIASRADPNLLLQLSEQLHALAECSGEECVLLDGVESGADK
jgi:arylsulfatase A-like enzyme